MQKKVISAAVLAAVMTVGACGYAMAGDTAAAAAEKEKCFGVAKAGKNDCAAKDGSHSCAGQAAKDANANEWLYVPAGLCDKLAGGQKG